MSPFKKKLTREQQEEILRFAHRFYLICSACREAFTKFQCRTSQLYHLCREALQQDIEPVEVSTSVDEALAACQEYAQVLATTYDKYVSLKPPAKWYPKELRKAYDSWGMCLSGEMEYLQEAMGALQPPKPLAHEPKTGNDKLNLFVGGLNYLSFLEMSLRELPLWDVRSTELWLGIDLSFEDVKRITEQP